jgi:uncharacterized membrane protein
MPQLALGPKGLTVLLAIVVSITVLAMIFFPSYAAATIFVCGALIFVMGFGTWAAKRRTH